MQRWITVAIAAAALAATTGLAQADDHHGHDARGHSARGHDAHASPGNGNWRGHESRGHESWHPAPHGSRHGYSSYGARSQHAPEYHRWTRGGYLPRAYFGPRYIVRDYGYYGLRAPPAGYGWVRVNNDFLLAALATGFVADVLFGGYY